MIAALTPPFCSIEETSPSVRWAMAVHDSRVARSLPQKLSSNAASFTVSRDGSRRRRICYCVACLYKGRNATLVKMRLGQSRYCDFLCEKALAFDPCKSGVGYCT